MRPFVQNPRCSKSQDEPKMFLRFRKKRPEFFDAMVTAMFEEAASDNVWAGG